jgi:hypothetical protein
MGTFVLIERDLRELLRRYLEGEGASPARAGSAASATAAVPAIPPTDYAAAGFSFACFKRVWIAMRFGAVHHFCPMYLRSRDYTCAILATALAMLSHSDALWWRVGLVHALHVLHATQPRVDAKVPIRVSLVSAQRLSALVDALRAAEASDATRDGLAAIAAMYRGGAFCFAAFEGPYLRADCDKFVHRTGAVQPEDWWCPSEEPSFASQLWPNDEDDPALAQRRVSDANAAARDADRASGRSAERSAVLADAHARTRLGGRRTSSDELIRRDAARMSGALLIGVVQLSALAGAESAYSAALAASRGAKKRNVVCRPASFARAMQTRLEHIGAYGGVAGIAGARRAARGAAASGAASGAASAADGVRAAQRGGDRVASALAVRAPSASAAVGGAPFSSAPPKKRAVSRRRSQYEEAPDDSSSESANESERESESERARGSARGGAGVANERVFAAAVAAKRLPVAAGREGANAATAGTDVTESIASDSDSDSSDGGFGAALADEQRNKRARLDRQHREAEAAARAAKRAAEAKDRLVRVTSKRAMVSGKGRKPCRCGSTLHSRTTHRACPLRVPGGVARTRLPQAARVRAQIEALFAPNARGACAAASASASAGSAPTAAAAAAAPAGAAAHGAVASESHALAALERVLARSEPLPLRFAVPERAAPPVAPAGAAAAAAAVASGADGGEHTRALAALAALESVLPQSKPASLRTGAGGRAPQRKRKRGHCRCGSTSHSRITSRECPLNPRRQRAPTAAAAIEGVVDGGGHMSEAQALAELERALDAGGADGRTEVVEVDVD